MKRLRALVRSPLSLAVLTLAACGDGGPSTVGLSPDATAPVRADAAVTPADAAVAPDAPGRDAAELTPDAMADAGTLDTGPGPLDVRITGLTASVSVSFDRYGVTHIRCQTDADCFAAEGYYHAAHRFAQMDLRRRVVRGRLAELFGDITGAVVDQDYSSRLFLATPDGGDLPAALLCCNSNLC